MCSSDLFAEISISDTGPGREQGLLQAEGQADAETEARADRVHRFPRKGVGMPLIVRTVGHCGGSVLVQDGPGGGTRVTIALPVVG